MSKDRLKAFIISYGKLDKFKMMKKANYNYKNLNSMKILMDKKSLKKIY